jgi:hypothetical protein
MLVPEERGPNDGSTVQCNGELVRYQHTTLPPFQGTRHHHVSPTEDGTAELFNWLLRKGFRV